MPEVTFDEVKTLGRIVGLEISDEDLVEVTHRLNVIISGVEKFSHPDLDRVDPVPFRPLEEVGNG